MTLFQDLENLNLRLSRTILSCHCCFVLFNNIKAWGATDYMYQDDVIRTQKKVFQ